MLQTEYIRNLNCNYERILLDKLPEENKYQYCIVTRGGIKGLLPCSLRYINDQAYLYYDISSTQSVAQLFAHKSIQRQWIRDLLWWMRKMKQEMGRFLLDDSNLLWYPEQIYQDLERNDFFFVYVPYFEEKNGIEQLFDYLVEHIDYEDDVLVETVYKMHDQYRLLGEVYLAEKIFDDAEALEQNVKRNKTKEETEADKAIAVQYEAGQEAADMQAEPEYDLNREEKLQVITAESGKENLSAEAEHEGRRGIRYFLDSRKKKQREEKEVLYRSDEKLMPIHAVAEENSYQESVRMTPEESVLPEEFGRTMYIEDMKEEKKKEGLYDENGKEICTLDRQTVILGKKKEEADCVLDHGSVSRMHARITREKEELYLEDLNSTNGTWKNGLRLQPYEKRKLEKEDEIRLGRVVLFYR